MNRRFFLLAAPAIVAAPSLMKVSAVSNFIAEAIWASDFGPVAREPLMVTVLPRIYFVNPAYVKFSEWRVEEWQGTLTNMSGITDIIRGNTESA